MLTPLPLITGATGIDGTSEASFLGQATANILVQIDGRFTPAGTEGLVFAQTFAGTYLQGLSVFGFTGAQVELDASSVIVQGNDIGFAADAPTTRASLLRRRDDIGNPYSIGLLVQGGYEVIGGLNAADPNVISGNGNGLYFLGTGALFSNVAGNRIGTDSTGTVALPNLIDGIVLVGGAGHETIGLGNVISGNFNIGIELNGSSSNVIIGTYIGVDASGSKALPNGTTGICVDAASNSNTIGGTAAGAANVISGNGVFGIAIQGGSTQNSVVGNLIGTNAAGSSAIGNGIDGVLIADAAANVIGPGNVISGNGTSVQGAGIWIQGTGSTSEVVTGDKIGTDLAGMVALPNLTDGIVIIGGAGYETIGPGNVISGNANIGIDLFGSPGNLILGNDIGVDALGSKTLPNGTTGICVDGGSNINTIGETAVGDNNVISGNGSTGITIQGGSSLNTVSGNLIGTNGVGSSAIGNGIAGVLISDSPSNIIGPGDLISGNGSIMQGAGIWIDGLDGMTSMGNMVFGDRIGTDLFGESAIPNEVIGVLINDGSFNQIGGAFFGATNVISGNTLIGAMIAGTDATGNLIAGNLIGTDLMGTKALGNGTATNGAGVYIDGSPANFVGGTSVGMGNVISGNAFDGVQVFGATAAGNLFQGNKIGTDITGALGLGNGDDGLVVNDAPGTRVATNIVAANGVGGILVSGAGSSGTLIQGNAIGQGIGGQSLGNGGYGLLIINQAARSRRRWGT